MTRLQRWGLAVLIGEVLLLQAAMIDVLRFFTPIHLPVASVCLFFLGFVFGVVALVWEKKE